MTSTIQIEHGGSLTAEAGHESSDALWHKSNQTPYCTMCDRELAGKDVTWETCRESPDVFFKALKAGRLRGVIGIVGCSDHKPDHDSVHARLARELIQRDILVIVSGCAGPAMDEAGLMSPEAVASASDGLAEFCDYLDIPPVLHMGSCTDNPQILDLFTAMTGNADAETGDLPVAAVAPRQYLENTASVGLEETFGMVLALDPEYIKFADYIDAYIHSKRLGLEWCDQYRCSIHS